MMLQYKYRQYLFDWVLGLLSVTYIMVQSFLVFVSNFETTTVNNINTNFQSVSLKEQFIGISSLTTATIPEKSLRQQPQIDDNNSPTYNTNNKGRVRNEKSNTANKNEQEERITIQRRDNVENETSVAPNNQPQYYIVFSTSCNDQQHWESWTFFYHCSRVQQPGIITRIVSGCNDNEQERLQNFHDTYVVPSFGTNYKIHFTPDFSRIALDHGYGYKYMNKPYGLKDWFLNGPLQLSQYTDSGIMPNDITDSIVFLLDPDMILLRPIVHDYTNQEVIFVEDNEHPVLTKIVKHGYPMAQQDGYLHNDWMYLNHSFIFPNLTRDDIRNLIPSKQVEGPMYWNTGPPYLATVRDMYQIAVLWSDLAPRVLESKPELFSEMYGYILATVQLGLRHTLIKSLVISETTSSTREGWNYIDQLSDSNELCEIAINATSNTHVRLGDGSERNKLPIGLHYCSRYILGKTVFSKYRVKKNIMKCEKNLLLPLQNLSGLYPAESYYQINPPKSDKDSLKMWIEERGSAIPDNIAKREAFMLCAMSSALNTALRYLKVNTTYCTGKPIINLNETYTVYTDPTNH